MDKFANDGLTFDVTDVPASGGENPQAVILLHGFPEDRRSWDAVIPQLAAAGYRVLAPDLRGYSPGARPSARSAYTLRRLAGDVLALADDAGAGRFHLAGHDWGAALAWHLAATRPDRVESLAALSVPHPQAFSRSMVTSRQALMSWYIAAFQPPWLPERVMSLRGGELMAATLLRGGLDAASAGRYARRAASPAAMRGPLNWYRALPLEALAPTPAVTVPTLFLWGDRERFISRAAAELCGAHVEGSYRFEVLAGASHWLLQDDPRRVSQLLASHFAASASAARL